MIPREFVILAVWFGLVILIANVVEWLVLGGAS